MLVCICIFCILYHTTLYTYKYIPSEIDNKWCTWDSVFFSSSHTTFDCEIWRYVITNTFALESTHFHCIAKIIKQRLSEPWNSIVLILVQAWTSLDSVPTVRKKWKENYQRITVTNKKKTHWKCVVGGRYNNVMWKQFHSDDGFSLHNKRIHIFGMDMLYIKRFSFLFTWFTVANTQHILNAYQHNPMKRWKK